MKSFDKGKYWYTLALYLFMGSAAHATTLYVTCGARSGGGAFTKIGAALKALQSSDSRGPATINVSGACNENIQITNMDGLTLNAINGASISDTSNGVVETIGINRSTGITINGLTVNGGLDAIRVWFATATLNGITAQGSVNDGVSVYVGGNVNIVGGTLQNNQNGGLAAYSSDVLAAGVTAQHNGIGVMVDRAGRVLYRPSDPLYERTSTSAPAVITQNNDAGLFVRRNGQIQCASCQITNNGSDGVRVDVGATVNLSRYAFQSGQWADTLYIADNGAAGVSVGDLSSTTFPANPNNGIIQHNGGQFQIVCNNAVTSVTRFALQFVAANATNCTN
jgi:hypothetical protein